MNAIMNEEAQRKAFEEWISAPPFESDVARFPMDETKYKWPGSYVLHEVSVAWEAWKEAICPEKWRVCWTSRKGNVVRTRWKSYDQGLSHLKAIQGSFGNAWMESNTWKSMTKANLPVDTF